MKSLLIKSPIKIPALALHQMPHISLVELLRPRYMQQLQIQVEKKNVNRNKVSPVLKIYRLAYHHVGGWIYRADYQILVLAIHVHLPRLVALQSIKSVMV